MTRIWLAVVIGIAAAEATSAQVRVVRSGDDRLDGIRMVDVLVTVEGAPECPAIVPVLQTEAIGALRSAGLSASASDKARSWFHSVVIDVRSRHQTGTCAAAVTTELVVEVEGLPASDRTLSAGQWGSLLLGVMPLLRESTLVLGPRLAHDAAVRSAVLTQVTTLARTIRSRSP